MYPTADLYQVLTLTLCKMLFLSLVLLFMIRRENVHEERCVLVAPVQNEAGEDNCYERVYVVHGKLFHIQQPTSSPEDLG